MSSVTLFSMVEVGLGEEEKFVQFFKEVRRFFSKQPGFIMNQLFRAQNPKSTHQFMVMGKWESPEALWAAIGTDDWKKLMKGRQMVLNPVAFEEVMVE